MLSLVQKDTITDAIQDGCTVDEAAAAAGVKYHQARDFIYRGGIKPRRTIISEEEQQAGISFPLECFFHLTDLLSEYPEGALGVTDADNEHLNWRVSDRAPPAHEEPNPTPHTVTKLRYPWRHAESITITLPRLVDPDLMLKLPPPELMVEVAA